MPPAKKNPFLRGRACTATPSTLKTWGRGGRPRAARDMATARRALPSGRVGSVRVVWCYNRKVCRSRASYGPSYVSLVPRAPSYLMRVGYRVARWTSARVSAFHRA